MARRGALLKSLVGGKIMLFDQLKGRELITLLGGAAVAWPLAASAPDKVDTRIGTLDFKDGAPSKATLEKALDQIDFTHAYNAFVNTMQGVSLVAARRGALDAGVKDNEIIIFSELMDAKSLFLTANADTVYFVGFIEVSKGPMV
jgi:hypothetical protein